ncbi:MAG: hypothetical protein KDB02_06935 [Acidimicrobiales bacterium]|nr:hypothetical protein [Acidimicrobiales bacterium]
MQNKSRKHVATVVTLTALSLGTLVGCGAASDKATEKLTEKAIEAQTGGDVDIDTKGDGSFKLETEDGSFESGTGKVPSSWPDDVPLPKDIQVLSGQTTDTNDGKLVAIVATTTTAADELLAELKEALSGWKMSGETTSTGGGATITGAQWDTEGRRVTFAATTTGEGETSLTIGHTTIN